MKAIVKAKPEIGGLEFRELPVPQPGPHDVLIKNKCVAICGTDLHIYKWDPWSQGRLKLPRIIGHEFAGEIVEIGCAVEHFKVGDYVSGEGHLVCGFCQMCRTHQSHICENWVGLGYDVDGAFAEYIVLPEANVWVNDPNMKPEIAACQDPLGNAVHAVFAADCVGKKVVVFGCGPVGILAVAVLKAIGAAQIIAIEWDNEYRRKLALRAGATHTLMSKNIDDVPQAIRDITGHKGADVTIELAGTRRSIQDAVRGVRPGGDAILLGIPGEPVEFNIAEEIVFKAIHIHGITGRRIYDTWYRIAGLLQSGALDIESLITHRFPFAEYERGFDLMMQGKCGKVVLDF